MMQLHCCRPALCLWKLKLSVRSLSPHNLDTKRCRVTTELINLSKQPLQSLSSGPHQSTVPIQKLFILLTVSRQPRKEPKP